MNKIVYQDKYTSITQNPVDHDETSAADEGWDISVEDGGEISTDESGLDKLQSQKGRPTPEEQEVDEGDMEAWLKEHDKTGKATQSKDVDSEEEVEEEEDTEFKLKNGIRYYDSKDSDKGKGYDFALQVTGDRIRSVVETEGNIILNLPKDETAEIFQSGNTLTVRVGKEKIEINLNKCKGVHLVGGQVEGEVEDADKKITTDRGLFVNQAEVKQVIKTITEALGKIGSRTYGAPELDSSGLSADGDGEIASAKGKITAEYSVGFADDNDPEMAEKTANAAIHFFHQMTRALGEKDSGKQKELWQNVKDIMADFRANDSDGGKTNNLAHLIGNVLLSEFGGKEKLLALFQKGLIPTEIADLIADGLKARPDENTKLSDVTEYLQGGQAANMSHASLAMIFDRAAEYKPESKTSSSSEDDE